MILKRILTRKSILGFGNFTVRDLSVQMILDIGKQNYLICSYFNLEKIDFDQSILDELGITSEYIINKPGKSEEKRFQFFSERLNNMSHEEKNQYQNQLKKRGLSNYIVRKNLNKFYLSKEILRSKNHGNK